MTPDERPGALGTETVLGKAMTVLHAFSVDDHALRFADLERRTGLPKATLHRLLAELEKARLLDRVDGAYHLGAHLFELGLRASVGRGLVEVATPFLEELYERTHELVHLGVVQGRDVVYLVKIGGHLQVRSPSRLGGRMPVHATAIGKALLAHGSDELREAVLAEPLPRLSPRTITSSRVLREQLAEARRVGVAFEREESAVGVVCVAAPVLDAEHRLLAAVSITGPATRFRPERHVTSVRAAARGIAAVLERRTAPGEP